MPPLTLTFDPKMRARLLQAMVRDGGTDLDIWVRKTLLAASARRRTSSRIGEIGAPPIGYRRWRFTGTLDAQGFAKQADVLAYIHDAVGTMCGCYAPPGAREDDDPGDPMWRTMNVQGVKARLVP